MKAVIRIIERISWLGGVAAILLLAAAVIIVCQMIVMRYFLGASTVWQTEFVIFSLVAATFIGSAEVLRQKGHVAVDLLPMALGRRGGLILELTSALLSMVFLGLLTYSGWIYFHEAWVENWTTETVWALPLWIPLFPLPLGMAMVVAQYVAEILKRFVADEPRLVAPTREAR